MFHTPAHKKTRQQHSAGSAYPVSVPQLWWRPAIVFGRTVIRFAPNA